MNDRPMELHATLEGFEMTFGTSLKKCVVVIKPGNFGITLSTLTALHILAIT